LFEFAADSGFTTTQRGKSRRRQQGGHNGDSNFFWVGEHGRNVDSTQMDAESRLANTSLGKNGAAPLWNRAAQMLESQVSVP
jgi:hypothetical protein